VADDVTPGELDRRLRDHESRTDRVHGELDSRITRVASESVTVAVWQLAERAHVAEAVRLEREHVADIQRLEREHDEDLQHLQDNVIKPLVERVEKVEDRPAMSTARWLGVVVAVCAALALMVQAYGTLKGAR
jgi:exosome complex RNA-binding protein Csl4